MLGAASVLFGKTKYVLAALKLTKLASLGSMAVTVGTYSMFFGFPYAVGMVGLIAVHEAGHAIAMHQRGIPFSPMVFVPFMVRWIFSYYLVPSPDCMSPPRLARVSPYPNPNTPHSPAFPILLKYYNTK